MTAYYNEIDPAAAHILRAQIDAGVIAPGDVDTRSIKDVMPDDLRSYTQCHFFAGGGLWSVAARLAGWPDSRLLWTGSCPCQPFSAAGKGLGTDDPRHLWPDFHRLIRAVRPPVVMGEQVAGSAGYGWFDGVRSDLESEGYASRAVDFPACAIDAPHQRNRLYWIATDGRVADHDRARQAALRRDAGEVVGISAAQCRSENDAAVSGRGDDPAVGYIPGSGAEGTLDHSVSYGFGGEGEPLRPRRKPSDDADEQGSVPSDTPIALIQGQPSTGHEQNYRTDACLYADTDRGGRAGWPEGTERKSIGRTPAERHLLRNGTYWSDAEWITCHDGKARRAQSGIRFLVDGLPGRVDLWRVGGNAIVPEAAAEVIAAFMDVTPIS